MKGQKSKKNSKGHKPTKTDAVQAQLSALDARVTALEQHTGINDVIELHLEPKEQVGE